MNSNTRIIDFNKRDHSLSKLFRMLKRDTRTHFKTISFPSFGDFVGSCTHDRNKHSYSDGLKILNNYIQTKTRKQSFKLNLKDLELCGQVFNIGRKVSEHQLRANRQTTMLKEKDLAGILGVTVSKPKVKKKKRKVCRSVWTVRK